MVRCPICDKPVKETDINRHLDSECKSFIEEPSPPPTTQAKPKTATFFSTPAAKRTSNAGSSPFVNGYSSTQQTPSTKPLAPPSFSTQPVSGTKRSTSDDDRAGSQEEHKTTGPAIKKSKKSHAPLAERMRPASLDEVAGQELVGPNGVLRGLIVTDRVPSMVLWGGPGTGKTTIARLIAHTAGCRFVEINSTSSGVGECKRLFEEAKNELRLTGRKTIIFCDEIHRFSKSQQDVFLAPVEAGQVTLIGATTENPSFKVVSALLSRCRTFTLSKLEDGDIFGILKRALFKELPDLSASPGTGPSSSDGSNSSKSSANSHHLLVENDFSLLHYLASFSSGDARTALNLLELAIDLTSNPGTTTASIKASLTQTLVYDRAGDQHYDTISAFHKSVRGSNADAALYYLARMLQSGEDPLYIARRMVVIASEDVGLADNTMLSLATATYSAAEKIGMPECRINLGHCAVALALAPKSVRAYRGLNAAYSALKEPGMAGLPVPIHLRNAPTKLMKEIGYGAEYKYNPDFANGQVEQQYLPDGLKERKFLRDMDLGEKIDPDHNAQGRTNGTNEDENVETRPEPKHPVKKKVKWNIEEKAEESEQEEGDDSTLLLNPDGD